MKITWFVAGALILATSGCRSSRREPDQTLPAISEREALDLAKRRFAQLYPERVSAYETSIRGDLDEDNWYVLFTGTGPYAVPGGYTPMLVNKTTGKIRVEHSQ